ncbi:MAG TPA: ligase-associated DNA damage response endonuclease PdeM, partial [Chryseolinea sp.]|nr:ligase-associated DNA damage response endonuclease PdeM [Chryseolinea sp.]
INHFRKSGIPVPSKANEKNLELIVELIDSTKPERVIFLGDLFHSHYNQEWEVFGELVKHFQSISFELVLGNHDILSEGQYSRKGITLHTELKLHPFIFTHHPLEEEVQDFYNLAGHIHPGATLYGKARQSITLPCFYFGKHQGILPAFGMFTGLARIKPKEGDGVYLIAENTVLKVNGKS